MNIIGSDYNDSDKKRGRGKAVLYNSSQNFIRKVFYITYENTNDRKHCTQ